MSYCIFVMTLKIAIIIEYEEDIYHWRNGPGYIV
jgi:hypothetical protein